MRPKRSSLPRRWKRRQPVTFKDGRVFRQRGNLTEEGKKLVPTGAQRSRACALHGVTGQTTRWWTYAWTSSCVRGATENEEEIERISSDSAQFSVDTPLLHVHNISCISYHMAAPFSQSLITRAPPLHRTISSSSVLSPLFRSQASLRRAR